MSNDIVFTPSTLKVVKRDLLHLLATIDKAIEAAGADNVQVDFLNMTRPERVEHILSGSARFFGSSVDDIKRRVNSGDVPSRKRYIAKLLRDYCGLTHNEIAEHVGLKRGSITAGLELISERVGTSAFADARMRNVWLSLISYLKLPTRPVV